MRIVTFGTAAMLLLWGLNSNAPAEEAAKQTNPSTPQVARATVAQSPDAWRLLRHEGRWWYWSPQNRWMWYREDGRWMEFQAAAPLPATTKREPQPLLRAADSPAASAIYDCPVPVFRSGVNDASRSRGYWNGYYAGVGSGTGRVGGGSRW